MLTLIDGKEERPFKNRGELCDFLAERHSAKREEMFIEMAIFHGKWSGFEHRLFVDGRAYTIKVDMSNFFKKKRKTWSINKVRTYKVQARKNENEGKIREVEVYE